MTEMLRFNAGKPRLSFLPASFWQAMGGYVNVHMVRDIAAVLTFGAEKYAAHNWRTGGSWMKVADSALRHCLALLDGEENDPESGLPHLGHLGCNLVFLNEFAHNDVGNDDRFKPDYPMDYQYEDLANVETILLQLTHFLDGGPLTLLMEALQTLDEVYDEIDDLKDQQA